MNVHISGSLLRIKAGNDTSVIYAPARLELTHCLTQNKTWLTASRLYAFMHQLSCSLHPCLPIVAYFA